jgi:hypothetical protein
VFRSFAFLTLVLTTVVLGGAAPGVLADEPTKAVVIPGGKSCQGTLQIRGTTYKLDQAIAYSSIVLDENCINVLLSSAGSNPVAPTFPQLQVWLPVAAPTGEWI